LVLFGGFDTRYEDRDEFIAFFCNVCHFSGLTQRFAFDDFQPNHCFTKLLKRNLHFVDEILSRFRTSSLTVVWCWSGSRSNQLSRNVITGL